MGKDDIQRMAFFSKCRTYRYRLTRAWGGGSTAMFVMLNPSTADEKVDDPTIRRVIDFSRRWGCGRVVICNLFAFRTPSVRSMKAAPDPIGPDNDFWIRETAKHADLIVAAWGTHGTFRHRNAAVRNLLRDRTVRCIQKTKMGHPQHPLYLRRELKPIPLWEAA